MYFAAALLTLGLVRGTQASGRGGLQDLPLALAGALRTARPPTAQERITAWQLGLRERSALIRLALCSPKEGAFTAILLALASLGSLRVGRRCYTVERIDLGDSVWSGLGTWADMYSGEPGRFMRFSLATPLVTAEAAELSQASNALPFPEPLQLFRGLEKSWRELGGAPLSHDIEHLVRASGCVVSSYQLRTLPVDDGQCTLVGYLGRIEYECRTPVVLQGGPEILEQLFALPGASDVLALEKEERRAGGWVAETLGDYDEAHPLLPLPAPAYGGDETTITVPMTIDPALGYSTRRPQSDGHVERKTNVTLRGTRYAPLLSEYLEG
jgi:hypothetical protein